jgi:magnesium chelatase family protein
MKIGCFSAVGYDGYAVDVECDIRRGLPAFSIVGLPGSAVQESRQRVTSAICASGLRMPSDRVLINLSPGNLPKDGSAFDLAIAAAVLQESGQLHFPDAPEDFGLFIGELGLDGRIRATDTDLAALLSPDARNYRFIFVSSDLAASVMGLPVEDLPIVFCACLTDLIKQDLSIVSACRSGGTPASGDDVAADFGDAPGWNLPIDFPPSIMRALTISAAGMHNILFYGPPGSGKTTAVRALEYLVPRETGEVRLQQLRIHGRAVRAFAGAQPLAAEVRSFREPHHGSSAEGILGGGRALRPGELALAHGGVLVLDEAPEFNRNVLQSLREPMEQAQIRLVRAEAATAYPCRTIFAMTMNLCPCGNRGRSDAICMCSDTEIRRYWSRLGGALYDRIEIKVFSGTAPGASGNGSPDLRDLRQRIARARRRQRRRYAGCAWNYNAYASQDVLAGMVGTEGRTSRLLREYADSGLLSLRQLTQVRRLALTIADLEDVGQPAGQAPSAEALEEARLLVRPELYAEYL